MTGGSARPARPALPTFPPLVEPGPPLTPDELARYSRHTVMPQVGVEGQQRLKAARVAVLGAGGLGSPVLTYLAAAGVGHLTVIDDDVVEVSNLQRQVIHGDGALGRPKVESAAQRLRDLNPHVTVSPRQVRLSVKNALDELRDHDLIIDAADNFAARYLVADACEALGLPCVWGAVLATTGQVSVFWPGQGPLYRDVFPDEPHADDVVSPSDAGVLGPMCGIIGAAMAAETVKVITGSGNPLVGRLWLLDAMTLRTTELAVAEDPARTRTTRFSASAPD